MDINYRLLIHSTFIHYKIPCSLSRKKKRVEYKMFGNLSQNMFHDLSEHPTQNRFISRSVMQALMHRASQSAPQVQAGRCQVETTERQFDSFIVLPLNGFDRLTV